MWCDSARLEIVIVESFFVVFITQKQRKIKASENAKIKKKRGAVGSYRISIFVIRHFIRILSPGIIGHFR